MDKLARLIMLMMAALGTLMVVTMPWHSASAMAEGAGDNGADDDDDGDDVDELIFENPVHIDESWKQAVHEYRDFIRESEGGLGTVCSKDEHCEEGKICDRNGRCKPNATDIDDACRYGLHTCMHKENSVMRKLAEQETKNRLGRVGSEETNTEKLLATALLPAPAQPMMQLPAPASMAEEGSEEHKAGAMLLSNAGSKGEGAGGGSNAVALTSSMAAYIKSVDLVENVAGGALTASGALPHDTHKWLKLAQDGRERVTRRPFYNYWDKEDRAWRVATGKAEANARKNAKNDTLKKKAMEFPNKNDIELREWFEKGGGKLNFIEPHGRESIKDSKARHLRAAEDISENDVVLEVPLKLTLNQLTVRNIPTQSGRYLGEYIGGCFGKDQDWGLAALLLYELHKGNTSKWWPFIRTLDMHVLSRGVLKEMRGTYAAELQRNWETEAESMLKYLDKHIGQKDHMGNVKKWSTRKELRWALWAVRRHAVSLTKVTTGKRIRALVPFANYLTHSHGAGGSVTVGLDNKVRIALSAHDEGQELRYEREPYGDGEELLRFHTIDDSRPNPNNRIKIALPGARTRDAGDVFWEWHTSKMWRRFMKYPPSQSDLWRIANKLHLYGEEWDEDEQKAISNSNRILSGLPMPTDMVSAEEQLMLLGHASTPEEAQLIVYGGAKKEVRPENVQLYTAPDPEDDERAQKAIEEMADALVMLQEAVAADHKDPSVLEAINASENFFKFGVQPKRGLDPIDKLMTRKRTMMDQCGNRSQHFISHRSVSPHLFCALRVHVMNETDMDVVCPMQKGAFWVQDDEERKCEGGGFDWEVAISSHNENMTIQALRDTLTALQSGYETSIAEDTRILGNSDDGIGKELSPTRRASVSLRKREKELIESVIDFLDTRRRNLDNITYQIDIVRKKEEDRKRRIAERKAWRERIFEELSKKKPLVEIPVDLGAGKKATYTVMEGDDIEKTAMAFGIENQLTYAGLDQIKAIAKQRIAAIPQHPIEFFMPVILADGVRVAIRVNRGANATLEADKFCAKHGVPEDETEQILKNVKRRHRKRMNRTLLLTFPLTAPDGRTLNFDVRQGEQHDLIQLARDFSLATSMNIDAVQLANIAHKKLRPQIMELPVDLPASRRIILRVRHGDDPQELVEAFCEFLDLPRQNVAPILTAVRKGMNPGAIVVPAVVPDEEEEDNEDGDGEGKE